MTLEPDASLSGDEAALYAVVFERTLVSQMIPAVVEKTVVTIAPEGERFRLIAQGSVLAEPGWMTVTGRGDSEGATLPHLTVGQALRTKAVRLEKGTTRPPPRFSEAALVRYLERKGIGRPSTYADMIAKLGDRGYTTLKKGRFVPEVLGVTADNLGRLGFDELFREDFTAKTEKALDGIAGGELSREEFLGTFYARFQKLLLEAEGRFARYAREHPEHDREARVPHGEPCKACGGPMVVRTGKSGRFAKCARCGKTIDLTPKKEAKRPCPKCGGSVVEQVFVKDGKRKRYYRCTGCDWKSSAAPGRVRREPCPKCGRPMAERKKDGKAFWACTGYPECRETASVDRKPARGKRPAVAPGRG